VFTPSKISARKETISINDPYCDTGAALNMSLARQMNIFRLLGYDTITTVRDYSQQYPDLLYFA
jgi:hypothetical protein